MAEADSPIVDKGWQTYDYANTLAQGGRFKVSDLGNFARWDPQVLNIAAAMAGLDAATYAMLKDYDGDFYSVNDWDRYNLLNQLLERYGPWHPEQDRRMNGVHKALIRALAEAHNREYRREQRRKR